MVRTEAWAFAAWLRPRGRLPTEAEWARAARAGTTTEYWTGNDVADLDAAGWHRDNALVGRSVRYTPPMPLSRRRFLRDLLIGTSALYLGCDDDPNGSPDLEPNESTEDFGADAAGPTDLGALDSLVDAAPTACPDLTGGTFIEVVPFTGDAVSFHVPVNVGWDGRLYTDLSLIDRDRLLTPIPEFYIRTLFPDRLDLAAHMPWRIRVSGLAAPTELVLDDLLPLARPMGAHVLECSGNSRGRQFGLLSACEWTGIPMEDVLARLSPDPTATRIEVSGFDDHSVPSANGHSTPGAAWIFTREQLQGAFLATGMGGEALTLDHGFPVRLMVPGWYGCTCIKWVDSLRFVDDDEPATTQMTEFASRTHQLGTPALARDYRPATLDQAAMPIRIERWQVDGAEVFRVIGILWGGQQTTGQLSIRFGNARFEAVDVCPPMTGNALWTVFEHTWRPPTPGEYTIRCAIDGVPTRRLDTGYYERTVVV